MQRQRLKTKVHRARVTEADLNYEGSLTLDCELMRAANLLPYKKIHVLNVSNGERFEAYVPNRAAGAGL